MESAVIAVIVSSLVSLVVAFLISGCFVKAACERQLEEVDKFVKGSIDDFKEICLKTIEASRKK
ncbi:MAG: hypothetical protein IJX47_03850 [Clostridia bacterium]|nr:hypothetical protein [Clostridia bacterium]